MYENKTMEQWDKELTVSCPTCGHRCGGHGPLCSKGTQAPTGNPKCHPCLTWDEVARLTSDVATLSEDLQLARNATEVTTDMYKDAMARWEASKAEADTSRRKTYDLDFELACSRQREERLWACIVKMADSCPCGLYLLQTKGERPDSNNPFRHAVEARSLPALEAALGIEGGHNG